MISDLDRREVHRLRARVAKLEQVLLEQLSAPYHGLTSWAATLACQELDHPRLDETRCFCRPVKP